MTSTLDTRTDLAVVPQQRPSLQDLRDRLPGAVRLPGEHGYDELVSPWNVAVPVQPAAVVAARTADDVATTVRFARAAGLTVGVQATGHGAAGALTGHVLVATRGLDELTVHPEGWVRVGAGVKFARVIEAAAPYGLAPLNGSTSDVGVVGYLTGGGVGPFTRTFGVAADRVRAFEVVTGDGEVRRVTADAHPDLFVALRGGKGAAGIVTAVEMDLVPLASFYGGALYFDGADTASVLHAWRTWSERLPELGTTSVAVLQLPPLPFIPEPLAGRTTVAVRFAWTGDAHEGARLLDQLRAVAPVVLDDAAVKPYAAVDSVHADPVDPMPVHEGAMLLRALPEDAVDALLAVAGPGSGSPQVVVEVRQLGGAYARPGAVPSCFDHRDAGFSVLTVGMAPDPRSAPHADAVLEALSAWSTGGVWPNSAPAHDAASARRAYSPASLARLAAVVATYDPDGVIAVGRTFA